LDFESEKLEPARNVHNPGLRLIERYAEPFENLHRSRQGVLRLGPCPTGHYPVIRPSRELVPLSPHLLIKGSQQDIAQQWRDGSLNAKDNFRFERAIVGWRGQCVVDLRRKR
jgi:hypothetical protein